MADISTTIPNLANQTKIANALIKIADKYEKICDIIYPVGSIYITVNNVNPDTLFGGKWEQIEGKFLLAASSDYGAGEEGGEAQHTLLPRELPSRTMFSLKTTKTDGSRWESISDDGYKGVVTYDLIANKVSVESKYQKYKESYDAPHNNMPPYIVVYIWKRTA